VSNPVYDAQTNSALVVIVFVLGGFVCILVGLAIAIRYYRGTMTKRMESYAKDVVSTKGDETVSLDDLNIEEK